MHQRSNTHIIHEIFLAPKVSSDNQGTLLNKPMQLQTSYILPVYNGTEQTFPFRNRELRHSKECWDQSKAESLQGQCHSAAACIGSGACGGIIWAPKGVSSPARQLRSFGTLSLSSQLCCIMRLSLANAPLFWHLQYLGVFTATWASSLWFLTMAMQSLLAGIAALPHVV